jgi:formate hydrogenlyase transcriptional activator
MEAMPADVALDELGPTTVEALLRFERLLSDATAQILNVAPEDVDATIQTSLSAVGAYLGSERGGIALFSEDGRSLIYKYGFFVPGTDTALYETDLARAVPWYAGELRAGRRVILPRLPEGLPPDALAERAHVAAIGLKSAFGLPLRAGGEVLGVLGWDHLATHRSWSPEFLSRVELLASVYANALYRRRAQAQLQKSLEEVRALKDRLEAENVILNQEARRMRGFEEVVGTSEVIARVLRQVEQVAPTDAAVLLLGETGTGKDVLARAMHERSRRREATLVTVNCAAMPTALVESELFGYEKGAFTGAVQRTVGRFEVAHGGTLFLDEIGELPLEVQSKLLRVLESGEFERLGSPRTIKVNVRLIAATNRDLEREVREGRFRADLFYRLSVFPLTVPPLREHPEDIPLLVWHFIARKQARLGRSIKRVPAALMHAFEAYAWPGNVRELENAVERALIMTGGTTLAVDPAFLQVAPAAVTSAVGRGASHAEAERANILAVLEDCGWKMAGKGNAAERLGLKRSTLQYRIKKLGIARPDDVPHRT